MKKNIIIIRNAAKSDFGGGERVPVFIAREVASHSDLKPIVFSGSEKLLNFAKQESVPHLKTLWWSKQNWSGIQVLLLPVYLMWQIILFFYYIVLFIKINPIVVHIQSKDDFIAGTFAARTLGIRVVWTDHADLKHIFLNYKVWYKNPIGKMVYFAANFTEVITVVSKEDRSIIFKNIPKGNIRNKMRVIYNGAFDVYKEPIKKRVFTFVSSGRLVTDKGIGEIIQSFNRFHEKYPNTALRILGDGPEKQYFKDIAKSNKSIEFLGHKSNPFDLISECHVFLFATHHEGFSLALVEACMLNMPIIATRIGGNTEIIFDHKTGLLIPIKDSSALFNAMELLYKNEKLRQEISDNARKEYLDNFQFDQIIKREFISLYKGEK